MATNEELLAMKASVDLARTRNNAEWFAHIKAVDKKRQAKSDAQKNRLETLTEIAQKMKTDLPLFSISDGSTAIYYELPSKAKELQDLISYKDMNAQIGEIFRACYRYGEASHSERLRDANKILFYAKAEVERLKDLSANMGL